ncbi:MAG: ROK family protein [Candidatus Staskawiczbacteria bacterium]|nr:ROK family protein [Candidatus Staskawiczbacteria bacterium]
MRYIRVIDGGGNGFRRADVFGTKVRNLVKTKKGEITCVEQLTSFVDGGTLADIAGISYAVAGDIKDGVVIKSPQLPWLNGVDLKAATKDCLCKQTAVVNDMDGAVAGMGALLNWPSYFMGITWSSGIGARVCRNGQIIAQCEAGHTQLDHSPFAPLCGCGLRGCVEAIIGGEAMTRRILQETEIKGIKIPEGIHPLAFLDDKFQIGDHWAQEVYDVVALGMGTYLATIQNLFRLPLVVWKGTFAINRLKIMEKIIRHYMRSILMNKAWEPEMVFVFSPQPETDALIGAAAIFDQVYGH